MPGAHRRAEQLENSRALVQAFLAELETARRNAQAMAETQTATGTEQQQNTAASEMQAAASEAVRFQLPKGYKSLEMKMNEAIDGMRNMEPVSTVNLKDAKQDGKRASEIIMNLFDKLGGKVFRKGFGNILLTWRGVKNDVGHGINPAKVATAYAIPDVLERGDLIDSEVNWKGRSYDSYTFMAPVTVVQGKTSHRTYVAVIVRANHNEVVKRFYLHEVLDADGNRITFAKEKRPSLFIKTGPNAESNSVSADTEGIASNSTIAESGEDVKHSRPVEEMDEQEDRYPQAKYSGRDQVSYDTLVSLPDMQVTELARGDVQGMAAADIIEAGLDSTERVNGKEYGIVKNRYTGTEIIVTKQSLRHGLLNRADVRRNGPYVLQIGDVLSNAVKVNELQGRKKEHHSDIYIGTARTMKGEPYAVRFVVNVYADGMQQLADGGFETIRGSLYAHMGNKNGTIAFQRGSSGQGPLSRDGSDISIEDLLDFVNTKAGENIGGMLSKGVKAQLGSNAKSDLDSELVYSRPVEEMDEAEIAAELETLEDEITKIRKTARNDGQNGLQKPSAASAGNLSMSTIPEPGKDVKHSRSVEEMDEQEGRCTQAQYRGREQVRYANLTSLPDIQVMQLTRSDVQGRQLFDGSKVVDQNGEPLVLYHQTQGDFTVFAPARTNGAGGRGSGMPRTLPAAKKDRTAGRVGQKTSNIPKNGRF